MKGKERGDEREWVRKWRKKKWWESGGGRDVREGDIFATPSCMRPG